MTTERVKCRVCGTRHAADAAGCPVCGTKIRSPAGAGKAKPEPFGLDSETLLAKIDALDWDDPATQSQASAAAPVAPSPVKRSLLLPFLIGFAVLLLGAIALRYFSDNGRVPPVPVAPPVATPKPPVVVATVEPRPVAALPDQQPAVAPDDQMVPIASPEEAEKARREEARRQRVELKRKALAAKQAMEEQSRRERAEQDRLRAEKEAAEARGRPAAAAVVPPAAKGPTSPQEVCAAEQSVFSRGACESRVCAEPQWRSHSFCVKRWQDELRKLSPSGNDG